MKKIVRSLGIRIFGQSPRIVRIPFGPIRGSRIFMSFDISPRMFLGFDETWIAKLAVSHIQPGDTVYDVGAHIGYTTLIFAKRLAGQGAVHAFELLPSTSEGFLKQTIDANRLSNVVIHTVGLSDVSEVIELSSGSTKMTSLEMQGSQTDSRLEMCQTEPLDNT